MKYLSLKFLIISAVFLSCSFQGFTQDAGSTSSYDPDDELKFAPDYFLFGNMVKHVSPGDSVYYKDGYSFGLGSNFYKTKYVSLRFSLGYSFLKFEQEAFTKDYREDFKTDESIGLTFNSKDRRLVTISPEIKIKPYSTKRFSPYLLGGITGTFGLSTMVIEAETNTPGQGLEPFIETYSVNRKQFTNDQYNSLTSVKGRLTNRSTLNYSFGLGIDYFPLDHAGIFLEYKYSGEILSYKNIPWKYQTLNFGIIVR